MILLTHEIYKDLSSISNILLYAKLAKEICKFPNTYLVAINSYFTRISSKTSTRYNTAEKYVDEVYESDDANSNSTAEICNTWWNVFAVSVINKS